MRRIGILGGTFDPPHLGHLILAEYAADALTLDHLLFVPAADPPHKQHQDKTSIQHRLAMLKIAVEGNARFSISTVDIEREGPHYSLDMMKIIKAQYPDAELFFVMGGDSLHDLPKWHRPNEFVSLCTLAVMRRPGDNVVATLHDAVLPGLSERLMMIDAPVLDISSSAIVDRIRHGRSVRYLVPDNVRAYIETNQIYRNLE